MSDSVSKDNTVPPNPFQFQSQRTQEQWEELIAYFSDFDAQQRSERNRIARLSFSLDRSEELPGTIDHTLLKIDADRLGIDRLCEEAKEHEFKSVCVRLPWVRRCEENLRESNVVIACVVGFHEGTYATSEKVKEAAEAVAAGAKELDMVMNYEKLKEREFVAVFEDIAEVRKAIPADTILKVILETAQLSQQDIINGCIIADEAGADFVKTSTGFNGEGAKIEHITLMKNTNRTVVTLRTLAKVKARVPPVEIKASGGIRDLETAQQMLVAGASRLGTSSGVQIVQSWKEKRQATEEVAKSYVDDFGNENRVGSRSYEPRSLNSMGPQSL